MPTLPYKAASTQPSVALTRLVARIEESARSAGNPANPTRTDCPPVLHYRSDDWHENSGSSRIARIPEVVPTKSSPSA